MPCCARPLSGLSAAGTPPDPLAQTFGVRLDPQQSGRIGEHRARIGLGESPTLQHFKKHPSVLTGHLGPGRIGTLGRLMAEVAEAVNDLLG